MTPTASRIRRVASSSLNPGGSSHRSSVAAIHSTCFTCGLDRRESTYALTSSPTPGWVWRWVGRGIDGGVGRGLCWRFFRAEDDPPVRGVEPGATPMRARAATAAAGLSLSVAGVIFAPGCRSSASSSRPNFGRLASDDGGGGGLGLDLDPGVIRLPRLPMTAISSESESEMGAGSRARVSPFPFASPVPRSSSISSSATVLYRGFGAAPTSAPASPPSRSMAPRRRRPHPRYTRARRGMTRPRRHSWLSRFETCDARS